MPPRHAAREQRGTRILYALCKERTSYSVSAPAVLSGSLSRAWRCSCSPPTAALGSRGRPLPAQRGREGGLGMGNGEGLAPGMGL